MRVLTRHCFLHLLRYNIAIACFRRTVRRLVVHRCATHTRIWRSCSRRRSPRWGDEKSYNAARYPGKAASRNEIQRRLEDDFEAELERTRGAQRKHPGAQPNQVRTISAGSAIQSSRRSIQDAAQRLAWRVKVLPIEEIVDANLRLDGQPFPSMGRLDLPPKLQVKRKHVAETFLTRWWSRNRRSDCAERDQLRFRK